jgi:hypothetical protein
VTQNDSFFLNVTINIRKIPPSTLINFATRVQRSRVFSLVLVFGYACSSIQIASEEFVRCFHFYFVNFALHLSPGMKILLNYFCRFKQLCHVTQSESDTCSSAIYFLTMIDTTTPNNFDPPPNPTKRPQICSLI